MALVMGEQLDDGLDDALLNAMNDKWDDEG